MGGVAEPSLQEDDEEDLLRRQDMFLKSNDAPSASVVDARPKKEDGPQRDVVELGGLPGQGVPAGAADPTPKPRKKKSLFSQRHARVVSSKPMPQPLEDQSTVLKDVVEKDRPTMKMSQRPAFEGGFPEAKHRREVSFAKNGDTTPPETVTEETEGPSGSGGPQEFTSDEAQQIHLENVKKIEQMTPEEIEEAQKEIFAAFDPVLLEGLRKRQQTGPSKEHAPVDHDTQQVTPPRPTKHSTHSANNSPRENMKGISGDSRQARKQLPQQDEVLFPQMSHSEIQKMKWMEPLDQRDTTSGSTPSTRYQFDGDVITEDVPVHKGLHHHGDEPGRAGYTMDELLQLTRSSVPNQRTIALSTLGNVVTKVKLGTVPPVNLFDKEDNSPLLFFVNASLDHNTNVSTAGIKALAALLCDPGEEELLNLIEEGHRGFEFFPGRPLKPNKREDDEKEITDAIQIAVEWNIIDKLRSTINAKLGAWVDKDCFRLLIAMARHSTDLAYRLTQGPSLLDCIGNVMSDDSCAISLPYALTFFRVLAQSGRHTCQRLMQSGYINITKKFLIYDASAKDTGAKSGAIALATIESLKIWTVSVSYGYDTDMYLDLFPKILNLWDCFISTIDNDERDIVVLPRLCSAALNLTEALCHCVVPSSNEEGDMPGSLAYSHLYPFAQKVISDLKMVLGKPHLCSDLFVIGAASHFVASFLHSTSVSPLEGLPLMESVTEAILNYLLEQSKLKTAPNSSDLSSRSTLPLFHVFHHSMIQSLQETTIGENPTFSDCRPTIAHTKLTSEMDALTKPVFASVQCMYGLLRALSTALSANTALRGRVSQSVEVKLVLWDLCRHIVPQIGDPVDPWEAYRMRIVVRMCWQFAQVLLRVTPKIENLSLICHISRVILPNLLPGDEAFGSDVLSQGLFNMDVLMSIPKKDGLEQILNFADILKHYYLQQVRTDKSFQKALAYEKRQVTATSSYFLHRESSPLPLPRDWMWLPIVDRYQQRGEALEDEEDAKEVVAMVGANLCMSRLLLDSSDARRLSNLQRANVLFRVLSVFCLSDVYREEVVEVHLQWFLDHFMRDLQPVNFEELLPTVPIAGMGFFTELFAHFAATSFGHPLFTSVVTSFLHMGYPHDVRRAVLEEVGHTMGPVIGETLPVVGLSGLFSPLEKEKNMIDMYASLLGGRNLQRNSALLYSLAIYHISGYLCHNDKASAWEKTCVLLSLVRSKGKDCIADLAKCDCEDSAKYLKTETDWINSPQVEANTAALKTLAATQGFVEELQL